MTQAPAPYSRKKRGTGTGNGGSARARIDQDLRGDLRDIRGPRGGGLLRRRRQGRHGRRAGTVHAARRRPGPRPVHRLHREERRDSAARHPFAATLAQRFRHPAGTRSVPGGTPGLYGGTRAVGSCDVDRQVRFLTADRGKARAFARVSGITQAAIPDYLRNLTPVVLRADTRVTNHGFRGGSATSFQSVLQAGTAVLVDARGLPRVRCACGNPLKPPLALKGTPRHHGRPWSGYEPTRVIVVTPAPRPVISIVIVNIVDNTWIERKTGDEHGDRDRVTKPPVPPTPTPTRTLPAPVPPDSDETRLRRDALGRAVRAHGTRPGPRPQPGPRCGPAGRGRRPHRPGYGVDRLPEPARALGHPAGSPLGTAARLPLAPVTSLASVTCDAARGAFSAHLRQLPPSRAPPPRFPHVRAPGAPPSVAPWTRVPVGTTRRGTAAAHSRPRSRPAASCGCTAPRCTWAASTGTSTPASCAWTPPPTRSSTYAPTNTTAGPRPSPPASRPWRRTAWTGSSRTP